MRRPLIAVIGTALALATAMAGTAGAVTLKPGDILVADYTAFSDSNGGVILIDPATGKQTVLSSNLQAVNTADPLFAGGPTDVLVTPEGQLMVVDYDGDKIVRVDPATGKQTLVTEGNLIDFPIGFTRAPDGTLLVAAEDSGPTSSGAIVRVNPATGAQTLISSNEQAVNTASPQFGDPGDVEVMRSGKLLVADNDPASGTGLDSSFIVVDPATGKQKRYASDDALLEDTRGFLIEPSGVVVAPDESSQQVLSVDPKTRSIAVLSSNAQPINAGSAFFVSPELPARLLSGEILVADSDAFGGAGGVIGVNRTSAKQRQVSSNTQPVNASSQLFDNPFGIAVVPPKCFGRFATIVGSNAADRLRGTKFPDVIAGAGGKDLIKGLGGDDLICGGAGKDRLNGGGGKDRVRGDAAADTLKGGPGRDRLLGGKGRDILGGGPGRDLLLGGPGRDSQQQ